MSLLTLQTIAKRLRNFEILAGIVYPDSEEVAQLWFERFKDYSEEKFQALCEVVEDHIKWHILPTPHFFLDIEEGPKQ